MMGCGTSLRVVLVLTAVMNSAAWGQDGKPASASSPASPASEPVAPAPGAGHDSNDDKTNEKDSRGWLPPGEDPENRLITPFLKHLVKDQEFFWTSPGHLQKSDWQWLVPSAVIAGGLVASDSWISKQVPDSTQQLKRSKDLSDYATFSLIGLSAGSFLLGRWTSNDHLEEAGLLSGEAAINSTAVAYFLKEITERPRPYQGNEHGSFFQGGGSFPSEHSAIAWSVASVWAHEYPGKLSQILAYGLASAVSVTRITSKQHFASDVAIGSALGWYFGRQVYRAHHDPELGGAGWGDPVESKPEHPRNPANMGSPYVPLDSWVYPALNRLAALGYVQSAYLGIRPWTRMECARLLDEVQERLQVQGAGQDTEVSKTYEALADEFHAETARWNGAANLGASLDSVYSRVMGIDGPPLRDGYHFGETIVNDFGRPFGEGANFLGGGSAHAVVGPFAFYVRGEYQESPSVMPFTTGQLQAIATADLLPSNVSSFSINTGSFSRFQLLEGSISFNVRNLEFSFGRQTAWLGPTETGPFLYSDNAQPITMFKIDTTEPFEFPLLSKLFGPARLEFFLGRLSGQEWVYSPPTLYGPHPADQPFIHADKISFKPTGNLEFGAGFTAVFAGAGVPFTFREFVRTYYAHTQLANDPGKRFSAFDFTYRIPKLRNWLTFYGDSLVVDEYSPIGSSRASLSPGIYMPQIPRIPKLQLRVEGVLEALTHEFSPGFVYSDSRYLSGYTNDGDLLGNWIGRAGRGGQGWATYSFSARDSLQLSYRAQKVSHRFLEGGSLNDFSVNWSHSFGSQLSLTALAQYENWRFPLLRPDRQNNFTSSLQLTYWPRLGIGDK
jgi:hypothetical protein